MPLESRARVSSLADYWWCTQVKAFRGVSVPEPKILRPARLKPTTSKSIATLCVGDHCKGKGRNAKGQPHNAAANGGIEPMDGGEGESGGDGAGGDGSAAAAAIATRRIPYRWMVLDRLGSSVKLRVDEVRGRR